jgi:hypothetical protein
MCRIFSLCGRASRKGLNWKTAGDKFDGVVQFVIIALIAGLIP